MKTFKFSAIASLAMMMAGTPSHAEMTQAEMDSCIAHATRQGEKGIGGPMLSIDSLRAYIARNPDCGSASKIEERPAIDPKTAEIADCVTRETNYYRARIIGSQMPQTLPNDAVFTAMLGTLSVIISERCGVNDFTSDLAKKRAVR